MLKNVILAAALVVGSLSYGQIVVKSNPEVVRELNRGSVFIASLTKHSDNAYGFQYRDVQYTHIIEFKSFMISSLDTFDQLGELLKEQMNAKKGTELRIDIDGTSILIKTNKMLGVPYLDLFIQSPSDPIGVMMLGKADIVKLFS